MTDRSKPKAMLCLAERLMASIKRRRKSGLTCSAQRALAAERKKSQCDLTVTTRLANCASNSKVDTGKSSQKVCGATGVLIQFGQI